MGSEILLYGLVNSDVALMLNSSYNTIQHDTRCYFNVRSKADICIITL